MKQIVPLIFCTLILSACKSDEINDKANKNPEKSSQKVVGEIEHIETLFDDQSFENEIAFNLLKELEVCDTVAIEGSRVALCSSENFKLIPFNENKDLKDAFVLQIKALTVLKNQEVPLPMRHLIVFERENGSLIKVNGFRGNLIATRSTKSGIKDLIIRFYIPEDQAFLNCLFEWKDKKYHFKSVEAIDGGGGNGSVKEVVKDSVSQIVYQSLMSNAMLF